LVSRVPRLAAALLTICALAGCSRAVDIKDVVENPRKYADQTVTIGGEVQDAFALLALKYYTLNDGTGTIHVLTERPLPRNGEKLRVTGRVAEAFSIGDQSVMILIEEKPKP
jgi:hypothetical protein